MLGEFSTFLNNNFQIVICPRLFRENNTRTIPNFLWLMGTVNFNLIILLKLIVVFKAQYTIFRCFYINIEFCFLLLNAGFYLLYVVFRKKKISFWKHDSMDNAVCTIKKWIGVMEKKLFKFCRSHADYKQHNLPFKLQLLGFTETTLTVCT